MHTDAPRNPAALQALQNINGMTIVRVYNDESFLEFVVMIEGNGRSAGKFAVIDTHRKNEHENIDAYIDSEHQPELDADGDWFVSWLNCDFSTPY